MSLVWLAHQVELWKLLEEFAVWPNEHGAVVRLQLSPRQCYTDEQIESRPGRAREVEATYPCPASKNPLSNLTPSSTGFLGVVLGGTSLLS